MTVGDTFSVKVSSKWTEATDVVGLELTAIENGALPSFTAGAHIDVHLPDGLIRQYSLCNRPDETHRYVIGVLRSAISTGGSVAVHGTVSEGDVLQIGKPRNLFELAPDAGRSLLFAGGIGITPILCMAEQLALRHDQFEMHYCTRSEDRTAFRARLQDSRFKDAVHFHFDDGDAGQKLQINAALGEPQRDTHVYVCGPKGFMDAVLGAARDRGWPEEQLHYEFFDATGAIDAQGDSFDVKIASSGETITIPAGEKVTKVLDQHGITIPTSCSQGLCGTCLTGVLEGVPDHRDVYLTPAEHEDGKVFLPCCSRSKTPLLVLDL